MIHIATVHFQSDRWIQTQLRHFEKHFKSPYRVYAWLNDVPPVPANTFYYTCTEPVIAHSVKLNILADLIGFSSERDNDILIFIDGDAFPVAEVETFLREKLREYGLIAIQRLENNGDRQPHPCFCATTVGFWRKLKGDWNEGFQWLDSNGAAKTDVGGNLLKLLTDSGTSWLPILRSHSLADHPVLFGVYGGMIYHHGAAFRNPVTRSDMANFKIGVADWIRAVFPWRAKRVATRRWEQKIFGENRAASESIFQRIVREPDFFERFLAGKDNPLTPPSRNVQPEVRT